jgi:hypothetical protein
MAQRRAGFREKTMFQRLDVLEDPFDPLEQIVAAERADWVLLRLVLCAGAATLLLALATTFSR